MPAVKIGPKHQITIPKEVFNSLNLEVGDFLDTRVKENMIVLIPKRLVAKDQEWFWTKEWQEKERQANEAIAKGDVTGPFSKASDPEGS
ncbi:MAG TPA: AbrB/MazE/SpoVT family DNA-binding domain-containing protein [Thermodesulfovibrionales bacterium]|nr:AbrB/MazE/SpoVT family DNA-binding domain-containing protein [Thermodesulfovibrionales bacterium]